MLFDPHRQFIHWLRCRREPYDVACGKTFAEALCDFLPHARGFFDPELPVPPGLAILRATEAHLAVGRFDLWLREFQRHHRPQGLRDALKYWLLHLTDPVRYRALVELMVDDAWFRAANRQCAPIGSGSKRVEGFPALRAAMLELGFIQRIDAVPQGAIDPGSLGVAPDAATENAWREREEAENRARGKAFFGASDTLEAIISRHFPAMPLRVVERCAADCCAKAIMYEVSDHEDEGAITVAARGIFERNVARFSNSNQAESALIADFGGTGPTNGPYISP